MKFFIVVGEGEKHFLEYESKPFTGSFKITVDHKEVKRRSRFFLKPLRETHNFDIGAQERLNVTLETERGLLSHEKTRLYINGRLVRCYSGGENESRAAAEMELAAAAKAN